ncbi:MAG: ABC transporter ATP-binding protein, partial [Alphaproteobacteria bacterium]|nr:ABC transporter ATP-binding protein [Alphaproteobacteria bacterium]
MLEVRELGAGYGRSDVLNGINLDVTAGACVGLLGANGAGKTTLLRTISGLTRVRAGEIRFEGRSIRGLSPERIVEIGIVHVPQGRMLFPEMTVIENLEMGAFAGRARAAAGANLRRVEDLFPILGERRQQHAGVLSGGEQQMLAIGRALMSCPRLLMLDEPSLGLAPLLVDAIFNVVRRIAADCVTILVAEQNAQHTLDAASQVHILDHGRIVLSG